jgi:uncharacterized protein YbjT (DUF2867 family)
MRMAVIGGKGLIGPALVAKLREHGHEAVRAWSDTGVNMLTGEGLVGALRGVEVVIDVSNSPSLAPGAALWFFTRSTQNLLDTGVATGVRHHVALSVVGADQLTEGGYFRAKVAQETLIRQSSIPFSIVHATQTFEFLKSIANSMTRGNTVRVTPVLTQPIAAADVVSAVARVAMESPLNGTVDVGGPEEFRMDDLIGRYLSEQNDARDVIIDPAALYFGVRLGGSTLLPAANAMVGRTRFADWIRSAERGRVSTKAAPAAPARATVGAWSRASTGWL